MLDLDHLNAIMEKAQRVADIYSDDIERHVGAVTYGASRSLSASNTFVDGAKGLPNTKPNKYEYMIHAEANLVFTAAREGVILKNKIIVCTLSPCQNCIRTMFQAGVREIYYRDLYSAHNPVMKDIKVTEIAHGPYTYMKLENY
jgi:deoxycytidylate deaminase